MAQLIKLQDYISRYETDIYRYPSQYVRLKKQHWNKLLYIWAEQKARNEMEDFEKMSKIHPPETKMGFINKLKGILHKDLKSFKNEENTSQSIEDQNIDDESLFSFSAYIPVMPSTEEDLKYLFLDELYKFQLKWGNSTITERSTMNSKYLREERLRYLLQRFPDTYLVLYEPIFLLQKAPVEVEIILITPTKIWCLTFLESEKNAAFIGSNEHFWTKMYKEKKGKVLNPLLSINRMEKIVRQIFTYHNVEIPIKKAIISRNGYIDYPSAPTEVLLLDKRVYEKWFIVQRQNSSPIKLSQLKAAQALLNYCETASFKRIGGNQIDTESDTEQGYTI